MYTNSKKVNKLFLLAILCALVIFVFKICGKDLFLTSAEIEETPILLNSRDSEGNLTATVLIKNTGKLPLYIDTIIADCHCLSVNCSKHKIQTKQFTKINILLHNRLHGAFQKNVFVYCNVESSPLLLTIQGEIRK